VSNVFVDTNVLAYSVDRHDRAKQARARQILQSLAQDHQPVISTQVLQEFYAATTVKLKQEPLLAKNSLHDFSHLETVQIDVELIEQGIDIGIISRISFWDGLIIAAAERAKCPTIFSEDLKSGQAIRGVSVVNPFIAPLEKVLKTTG